MAYNPEPKVSDCREIARKWGMDQVIVLGIDQQKGTFATASYGETRKLCAQAKAINDRIHRMVATGEIEIDA
jgi:hypothetical protein